MFPTTYKTFEEARAAAIEKHQGEIDRQIEELKELEDDLAIKEVYNGVYVPESETGFTSLYIEKGIHMYIHKLPVKMSGGNRSFFVKSKTRRRK